MTGKISTIIRVTASAPISTMSSAAMADVYGRRKASRTRPIMVRASRRRFSRRT